MYYPTVYLISLVYFILVWLQFLLYFTCFLKGLVRSHMSALDVLEHHSQYHSNTSSSSADHFGGGHVLATFFPEER